MRGRKNPPLEIAPVPDGAPLTFDTMAQAYLEDYVLQRYRTLTTARARVEHLRGFFGGWAAEAMTPDSVRNYQLYRRKQGAEAATVNRETSALSRMFQLAIRREQLERMPLFPKRLEENPPRDGFFEHAEYLKVRAILPTSFQDVLDFAYYSGWRRNEILELTWDEVDMKGGVIRLPPRRSKTRTGRVLPISPPLQQVLKRRRRPQQAQNARVFSRDGVPVREWRTALRDACRKAKIPLQHRERAGIAHGRRAASHVRREERFIAWPSAKTSSANWAEPLPPLPDGFIADRDVPLGQQVLPSRKLRPNGW